MSAVSVHVLCHCTNPIFPCSTPSRPGTPCSPRSLFTSSTGHYTLTGADWDTSSSVWYTLPTSSRPSTSQRRAGAAKFRSGNTTNSPHCPPDRNCTNSPRILPVLIGAKLGPKSTPSYTDSPGTCGIKGYIQSLLTLSVLMQPLPQVTLT